jgi:hypothetical protein
MDGVKLTDEQVAQIAAGETYDSGGSVFQRHDHIARLAIEVQQARQRRCDGCHYWRDIRDLRVQSETHVGSCINAPVAFNTRPDFFCADFTPKP